MAKGKRTPRARTARASWIVSDHRTTHPDTRTVPTECKGSTIPHYAHGSTNRAEMTREERAWVRAWNEDRVAWKDGKTVETPGPREVTRQVPGRVYRTRDPRTGDIVEKKIERTLGACPDVRPVEGKVRSWPGGQLSYTDSVQHGIVRED